MQHAIATLSSADRTVSCADVNEALGRIMASATFRTSPRLSTLLRFIVERSLAGDAACVKGYTIAVEAFGRHPDFDPQVDAIVRVEAGRLRLRLQRYYGGEGAGETVMIDLPRGSYVPVFRLREVLPFVVPPFALGTSSGGPAHATLQELIRHCRLRLQALVVEIALVETIVEQAQGLSRPARGGADRTARVARVRRQTRG